MAVTFPDVERALQRIGPYLRRTPIHTCSHLDKLAQRKLYFKCENFQKTGSFKSRGALNTVLRLKEGNPEHPGVVAHSSGNHAQALAWAARTAGLSCSVVVPDNSPQVKRDAIGGYGAVLYFCKPNPVSRQNVCAQVSQRTGQEIVSSHEHPDVIAGQGSIGVEFLEQVPELDAIFLCTSGGGMAAGVALAVKHLKPQCKVYVVEPEGKELAKSLNAGERLWPVPGLYLDTVADGIRVQTVGQLNFDIFLKHVERDVFTVCDKEIIEAMKLIWQRMKLVVETSAAATVAAVLSEKMKGLDPCIQHVGVVLCGGNTDIDNLPW